MKNEIWKPIINYERFYEISNFGRVKSYYKKELILKQKLNNNYLYVGLHKDSISKNKKIHQLVAIHFLNHEPNGMKLVINHKDLNKLNNFYDNLEITTQRENANKKHLKSTSEFTGVGWHKKSKKWQAYINFKHKRKYLGLFENEIDAHNAYQNELNK